MKSKFYKIYIVFSLIILAGFAYSVKAAYITTPDTTWTLSGSNLFPVSTSYSVGIGTTSPAHPLDVNGNILARGSNILFADLGATNREYITSNDSGISGLNTVGVFGFFADTSLGGVITSPTAGISAKGIYSNGYVGIGIASPNKQLHVYSTNPNAEIDIQSVLGAGNQWGLYNEITDNSFRVWGGDNYVSIKRDGKIGIGTTNPGEKLDVVGEGLFRLNDNVSTYTIPANIYSKENYDSLTLGRQAGTGSEHYVTALRLLTVRSPNTSGARVAFINDNISNRLSFGVSDSGLSTERLVIKTNGNVGIGTTNPQARLDLGGGTSGRIVGLDINPAAVRGDSDVVPKKWIVDNFAPVGTGAGSAFVQGGNSFGAKAMLGTNDAQALGIETSGAERMTILSNGNVGIGTTTPSSLLELRAPGNNAVITLNRRGSWSGVTSGLKLTTNDLGTNYWTFGMWANSTNNIYLGKNGGAFLTVLESGNVGIGTVAPGYKLDTYTPNTLDAYLRVQRQGTTKPVGITLANDTVNASYLYMPAGRNDLRFYTGGDRMTILNSNGNVGIGVTNPGAKLDVNGGIRTNNQLISTVAAGTPPLIVTSNTVVGNLNADMLDGQHYSNISDTIDSKISVAKSTNFGYRYAYDLWIYGETDKYYPFVIYSGDQNVKRDILIKRSYSETHPAEWNTATHGGGLTLKIKTNFGGWGGANYSWEIHELEEMYNSTFGGAQTVASYMGFAIFLRGGGPGGAIYHVYSDQPIEGTHPVHIQSESGTTGPFPVVYYNSETVQYGNNPSYTWVMPTALSTPDVEGIRIRKFIPLTQSINSNITSLSNNYIPKRSGSYFFANSLLFDNGTNLGIGTTSPQVRLHLGGDENTRRIRGLNVIPLSDDEAVARKYLHDNFAPVGTGAGSAFVQGGNSFGTKATLGTNDSQTLAFETAGAERMTILSGGNVGIGVTNPIGKLEIATSSSVVLNNSSLVGNYHLNLFQTSLNSGEGAGLAFTVFGSGDLSNSYTPGAAITFDRVGNNSQGGLHFKVKGTAGATDPLTDALFIKYDSNVGIGTTNPQARLDLGGGASGRIVGIDTNPAAVRGDSDVVPKKWIVDNFAPIGTGAGSAFVQGGNSFGTKATLGTNDSQTLAFETAGAERMTILSGGNVGIGNTNPSAYKLDVIGSIRSSDYGAGGSINFLVGDDSYLTDIDSANTLGIYGSQNSAISSIKLGSGGGIISGYSGNIGIGTTSPASKLTIQGVSATDSTPPPVNLNLRTSYGTGTSQHGIGFYVNSSSFLGSGIFAPPGALSFFTSSSWSSANAVERMRIDTAGNVGIGTVAPGYKLDTYTPNTLDAYLRVQRQGTTKPVGITLANDTVNASYLYMPAGKNDLRFYTGGDRMTILNSNGYVGIGTTGPTEELHVIGDAKVSGHLYASNIVLTEKLILNQTDIEGVNKLTVMTIDPLYRIKGINYSTFAPSFVGGVKEEIAGKIKIEKKVAGEYQAVIDFSKVSLGSDLWVWYNVIDFNKESVEVLLTPYGGFANTYYYIDGKKLVLKADRPVEVSYRLIAKRFDWKKWPTKATDQNEKPGFILD